MVFPSNKIQVFKQSKRISNAWFIILTSQYHPKKVQKSLQIDRNRIEEHPSLSNILKQLDEMLDSNTEEWPPNNVKLLQHLAGDEIKKMKKTEKSKD